MRRRAAAAGLAAGFVLALIPAASTTAEIYWANESSNTIARASLDGTVVKPDFITGATAPRGVAVDGSYVYWAHDAGTSGSIGRADLEGTNPDQGFIATAGPPQGVAVDNTRVYWTQILSGAGSVGRASLSSPGTPSQSFLTTGATPCGVASDADKAYWANGGTPGSIGRAHGGPPESQSFITATDDPCGLVLADGYVYWANRGADSIGRAKLDGSGAIQDYIPLDTTTGPCGVAVDGQHIYWTTASDTIGRADLDSTNPDEDFISDASAVQDPCGIAVTATQEVTPSSYTFLDTAVGSHSDIQAFVVANTSSSALDVTGVSLVGPNPGDFEMTGDGCTINVTPAGGGCLLNVRFAPAAAGTRHATIHVTSSASNSPTDISIRGVVPRCAGRPATIVGTAGDDRLVGTSGDDVVAARGGDDQIIGRGGDDLVCGGRGKDTASGGNGNDRLYGNRGNDTVKGNGGHDMLSGGTGADTLIGGPGRDKCNGGPGRDVTISCER